MSKEVTVMMTTTRKSVLAGSTLALLFACACSDDDCVIPDGAVSADLGLCGPGTIQCGGSCTNTNVDPKNCGACGAACKAGEVCATGKCALTCPSGQQKCGAGDGGAARCADTNSDPQNCGACGAACKAGEVCSAGKCALSCQSGLKDCSGVCVNLQSDLSNCGACGTQCKAGQVC